MSVPGEVAEIRGSSSMDVKSLDWHEDGGAVALGLVYLVSCHGEGWMAQETQTRTRIGLDFGTREGARLACQEDFEIRVLAYVR